MSSAALEIILPIHSADATLASSVASLIAQTDRRFGVLLSDALSPDQSASLNEAERKLTAAGLTVRRVKAPTGLSITEHWNWAHAQSTANWLKPLALGEQLKPNYVTALLSRIAEKPSAQFIRCDAALQTDWGTEILRAPFDRAGLTSAEFVNYFPARINWISRSVNVAYSRTAWLAMGGRSPQFPAFAALNLNVILALHYGVENLDLPLVAADYTDKVPLNAGARGRVNLWLELWLLLRQARNYCLSAKIAWPKKCLVAQSLSAVWRRL